MIQVTPLTSYNLFSLSQTTNLCIYHISFICIQILQLILWLKRYYPIFMSTFSDAARTFFNSSSPPSTLFINCFSSSSCFFADPSGWPFICDLARCAGLCLFPVVSVLSALRLVPLRNILSASRSGKTGGRMQVNHRFLWQELIKNWLYDPMKQG